MTEQEAQAWVRERWGDAAVAQLTIFADMVTAENLQQNIVAASSISQMWSRHIVDSAQLLTLVDDDGGRWIDVGTGGGFPGIVVAMLRAGETLLMETRRRRADFLSKVVAALALPKTSVRCERVERATTPASIISARAVAAPSQFFSITRSVADRSTRFILPAGKNAESALANAQQQWRGVFHVKQSVTDPSSGIIVAHDVRPR